MNRHALRGLTLVEGLVAAGLTVVLGVLVWQFIASSLGAHHKGQLSRSAQAGTREMMAILAGELRSASVPPLTSPAASSPVFWPGAWGAQESGDLGAFYPRLEVSVEDIDVDQATNRLVYVRSAASSDDSNLDPLARYALIELLVPETDPGRLERRVHRLASNHPLLKKETLTGADGAARPVWVLDTTVLAAVTPPDPPDVVYDAGPDSRVAFRVSHALFSPASDPGRTRNPELFEPAVFRIEVAVGYAPTTASASGEPWPLLEQWHTLRSETTELRIPSVRSY